LLAPRSRQGSHCSYGSSLSGDVRWSAMKGDHAAGSGS
jgi:hypothetical protein